MQSTPQTTSQQGVLLLIVASIVFILALAVTGWMGWRQWQTTGGLTPNPAVTLETTGPATKPHQNNDPLLPDFTVATSIESATTELTSQLFEPLRQYYATREERLGSVAVEASDDEEHTTQVTIKLTQNNETVDHTFFYDRSGDEQAGSFPTWKPAFLDNTE